ncbi:hypothetical protein [Rhodoferax sp. GW822-FHT02A01]|uniref:hypothetical protein n=1 Tax=Rhodoferax sp. GW822-FHT02A01 TaxID=3141537 RepID=UPI00315D062F
MLSDQNQREALKMASENVAQDAAQSNGIEQFIDSSLTVIIRPYDLEFSEYRGTRAQLEAEEIVPAGTAWPEGGCSVRWESGLLRFELKRTRPDGMKGPMKLWLEGDYWNLRWERKVRPDFGAREIMKKRAALEAELFRHSYEGQRQQSANWDRYWKAHEDKAFQAFKSTIIPQRMKRGRKSKVTQEQGVSNGQ